MKKASWGGVLFLALTYGTNAVYQGYISKFYQQSDMRGSALAWLLVSFPLVSAVSQPLWAAAAAALVQQIESIFLSPRLMGGATGLHPAYVLLLLSAGGLAAGLRGMLLSLPLFVCVRGAARALRCAAREEMP